MRIGRLTKRFGTGVAIAGLAAGAIGVGTTGAFIHSINNPETRKTSLIDAFSEGMYGTPDVDRMILGTDLTWGDVLGFRPIPAKYDYLWRINRTTIADAGISTPMNKYETRVARKNVSDEYTNYPYNGTKYPYRPNAYTPYRADGSMVFGMHNLRIR